MSSSAGTPQALPKRRGRPPKPKPDDVSVEKRRARVRKAQAAFLKRKEDNTVALKERVAFLEDTVRQLNINTIHFAREVVEQHPDLESICQRAVDIANSCARAQPEGSVPQPSKPLDPEPFQNEPVLDDETGTTEQTNVSLVHAENSFEEDNVLPLPNEHDWNVGPSLSLTLKPPGPDQADLLADPSISQYALLQSLGGPSFADHLIWRALITGFFRVYGNGKSSSDRQKSAFRFLTPHIPQDQIRWHAAWTIRSNFQCSMNSRYGSKMISSTNSASIGESDDAVIVRPVLLDMVGDRKELRESVKRLLSSENDQEERYLLASQVQQYLIDKGAYYTGYDFILMNIPAPSAMQSPFSTPGTDEVSPKMLQVTLSVPALLARLAEASVCLGYAVGFPAHELDQMIAESATSMQH